MLLLKPDTTATEFLRRICFPPRSQRVCVLKNSNKFKFKTFPKKFKILKKGILRKHLTVVSLLISLKSGIKSTLKDVGKGWFNLHETRMELYEVSKLKKFMNAVKFLLEDALRFLVEDSLESYCNFIEVSASSIVTIVSTSDVRVVKTLDTRKFPLFAVDLGVIDNKICYTTALGGFEEKLNNIIKQALGMLQNFPSIEREIMENLMWTHTPVLASVHHLEEGVINIQTRISKAISN